ncbi:hypothetical protein DXG03_003583 [Asterophora parasitica]|uniref:Uncharacterized protein n=1 Tax=Asterophora parasitica TaxID=117018 RepID=A0A9P7K9D8_9AGAR|nr:hypothetical protein DXG03_003583 [Asterophora parasitica]
MPWPNTVYTNSLLATLNARRSITGDDTSHMLVSLPQGIVTPSGSAGGIETGGHGHTQSKGPAPNISIRIDTTKESVHHEGGGMAHTHSVVPQESKSEDDLPQKKRAL